MALLPERRLGVVVMVNSWKAPFLHGDHRLANLRSLSGPADARLCGRDAGADARRRSARRGTRDAARLGLPPMDLASYEGSYRSDLYGPISVRRAGEALVLKMGEGEEADLRPLNRDSFAVRWRDRVIGEDNDTSVSFALDGAGRVARLTMQVRRDRIEAGAGRVRAQPSRFSALAASGSARPTPIVARGASASELVTG